MGTSYGWPGMQPRLKNLTMRGTGENARLWLPPVDEGVSLSRKGLAVTLTDQFDLSGLKILGGKR